MTKKQEQKRTNYLQDKTFEAELILHNDDYNAFEHVIESLIIILGQNEIQATQCTYIAHTKGTATVEKGKFDALNNYRKQFSKRGIKTVVEKVTH